LPERLVFYTSVLPLLAYYGLFATVLYPIAGSLHPMELMNSLMSSVPIGTQCAYQT
jgi:ATP/ADP translocase